jgi:hypothetical protein
MTPARTGPKRTARNIELYISAYRLAWMRLSLLQKCEQPDISLRLHDSIRDQIKEGAIDPSSIASEALRDIDKSSEPGTLKPQES